MLNLNTPRLTHPPESGEREDNNTTDANTASRIGKFLPDSSKSLLERSLATTTSSASAKHALNYEQSQGEKNDGSINIAPKLSLGHHKKLKTSKETLDRQESNESIIKYVGDTLENDFIDLFSLPSTPRIELTSNILVQDVSVTRNSRCNNRPKSPPMRDASQNSFVDDFYISQDKIFERKKRNVSSSKKVNNSSSERNSNEKVLPKRYQKYVDLQNYYNASGLTYNSDISDTRMYKIDMNISQAESIERDRSDNVSVQNTTLDAHNFNLKRSERVAEKHHDEWFCCQMQCECGVQQESVFSPQAVDAASSGYVVTTSPQKMYSDIGKQLADQIKTYAFIDRTKFHQTQNLD